MSSKETSPFDRKRKEQQIERKGVGLILIYRSQEVDDTDYIYVVTHKVDSRKGIREGDIGIPCETPEPNETFEETISRLFIEEVGVQLKDIKLYAQKVQRLEIQYPQHRIQGDLFLLWITNLEWFHGIKPQDTKEINRGLFYSLNKLLEDPDIQLRQDLNPRWFLEPLVKVVKERLL